MVTLEDVQRCNRVRLDRLDEQETRELVTGAWRVCVSRKAGAALGAAERTGRS